MDSGGNEDDGPPKKSTNMFDNMLALAPLDTVAVDEVTCYLQTAPEQVDDALAWWHERRHVYPGLSHMAHDYLSIPGE